MGFASNAEVLGFNVFGQSVIRRYYTTFDVQKSKISFAEPIF